MIWRYFYSGDCIRRLIGNSQGSEDFVFNKQTNLKFYLFILHHLYLLCNIFFKKRLIQKQNFLV